MQDEDSPVRLPYDWKDKKAFLGSHVVFHRKGTPVLVDWTVSVMIPLALRGDMTVIAVGQDGQQHTLIPRPASILIFDGKLSVGFQGSGVVVCLVLRWVKPMGPIH